MLNNISISGLFPAIYFTIIIFTCYLVIKILFLTIKYLKLKIELLQQEFEDIESDDQKK
jgi:hypothetical protein